MTTEQLLRTPLTELVGVRHPFVQTWHGLGRRAAPGERHGVRVASFTLAPTPGLIARRKDTASSYLP